MTLVIDASVTLAWVLGDEQSAEADAVLDRLRESRAMVPALWISEVANGLLTAERQRRITKRDAALAIDLIDRLPIEVVADSRESFARIHGLGATLGLTAYDATYLDLAIVTKSRLATLDDDLRRTARSRRIRLAP